MSEHTGLNIKVEVYPLFVALLYEGSLLEVVCADAAGPDFDNDSPYACALCVRASISGLAASC